MPGWDHLTVEDVEVMIDGKCGRSFRCGFTIIEVVLVLAVAGLVFLMVFVAFPALQRNQRDAQRRQDMANVSAEIKNLKANGVDIIGPGVLNVAVDNITGRSECGRNDVASLTGLDSSDSFACKVIRDYFNEDDATENAFKDPDGVPYQLRMYAGVYYKNSKMINNSTMSHAIVVTFNTQCDNTTSEAVNNGNVRSVNQANAYTVRYRMPETNDIFCMNGEL